MSTEGLYYDGEDSGLARDLDAAREERVRQMLQEALDHPGVNHSGLTGEFTVDGAVFHTVSRAQYERLMIMAPARIKALNSLASGPVRRPPARGMMTEEETRDMLAGLGYPDAAVTMAVEHAPRALPDDGLTPLAGHVVLRDGPEGLLTVIEREREPAWPDLGLGWDVGEILAAIAVVDRHLDEAAPEVYRQDNEASRLLNHWRRIAGGPGCEVHEATEALNLSTGGNPRKGVTGSMDDVLAELGDTAVSALLAIQSVLKDTDATWSVFIAALAKALSRVPQERPAPGGEPS